MIGWLKDRHTATGSFVSSVITSCDGWVISGFLNILIYKILIIIKNLKTFWVEIGLGGFREDWGVATSKRFGLGGAGSLDWMGEVTASISDSSDGEEYWGGEGD